MTERETVMVKTCATCLFGIVIPEDLGVRNCRRRAPKVVLATPKGMKAPVPVTVFPMMGSDEFCGDWTREWPPEVKV